MPRNGTGHIAGLGEIADIFGVSQATVKVWIKKGLKPLKQGGKGVSWAFRTSDVHKWLMENEATKHANASDAKQLQIRKLEAETISAELNLAKAKGEVAPVDDMKRLVTNAFLDVKARLRIIPERASIKLIGLNNETDIKCVLLKEIDKSLTALADPETWDFEGIE